MTLLLNCLLFIELLRTREIEISHRGAQYLANCFTPFIVYICITIQLDSKRICALYCLLPDFLGKISQSVKGVTQINHLDFRIWF